MLTYLTMAWAALKRNFIAILVSGFALIGLYFKNKSDRLERKTDELERDVETHKIRADANEIRAGPVPTNKHTILDGM
ncbi:hypothetical protein ACQU0X_08480 [Pseudovibrio ascidiaceicola]|uniref:hypothetical protein n=1 Tax=Pseudovibrio ascidiaceicola TaxID=285279 RepID=UPI003D365D79